MNVTLQDTVALQYCRRGTQQFLERHGLDWHEFRINGLPIEVVEKIDDDMAVQAVAQARRRLEGDE